jgi:hypothetical protein
MDVLYTLSPNRLQFLEVGDPFLCEAVIEMLDRGTRLAFDLSYTPDCICISLSQVLLMFLDALSEPLVPYDLYRKVISVAYEGKAACLLVIGELPEPNRAIFKDLINYLQRHCAACRFQGSELTLLARIISSVVIKRETDESVSKQRAKAKFIKHLISPEDDNNKV